jgi:hypothetical protein
VSFNELIEGCAVADESKALQMIADMLQQLVSERSQFAETKVTMMQTLKQFRESTVGGRTDFDKSRVEREDQLRVIREEGSRRHEQQIQILQNLLVAITRHNEAMDRHNELLARLLERGR